MATRGSQGEPDKKTSGTSGTSSARKTTPKKSAAKKSATKKPATKKAAAKKPAAKKAAAKSTTSKKDQMTESTEVVRAEESAAVEADLTVMPEEETQPQVASMVADKMIAFHLGGQRYAVPLSVVQEIQQIVAFSEIPASGGAVVGMVNLRGSVIPAIDMRYLIGLAAEEYTLETPMIICHAHGQLVALVVDEVEDVLSIPEGCMHPPPAMHNLSSKMIGVCRLDTDLVYLLDVESLVAPMELSGR